MGFFEMMNSYTIYLGSAPITRVMGTDYAYTVYFKTKELAELLNKECYLVRDDTGETIAGFDPDEE